MSCEFSLSLEPENTNAVRRSKEPPTLEMSRVPPVNLWALGECGGQKVDYGLRTGQEGDY